MSALRMNLCWISKNLTGPKGGDEKKIEYQCINLLREVEVKKTKKLSEDLK
jgi:hypothetical protein